ncbi:MULTISPECIES: PaaX family transcriptional regulator C-terminal domain-containing protein [unclassified Streptomyces]|uniref:PaaX family transcriptional regulator n=1 Tax=unclassified Streptomyces TaxID=2593676 RepID=UPI000A814555|nr:MULTISPECIES: PaaX family transcriptional regulator C-terminal domain-containing protein [unclassified Streptomyces]AZM58235.1 regulator [Streptomyces sp. WAC 01438]RSM98964.1 regulator [Streptomyces sp. WAC 01420]
MTTLDDLDSRPGSATSLLRTVIGCTMRDQGGWLSSADLVELMKVVDSPPARTRNALARVKARGLLLSRKHNGLPGYALAPEAWPMLARGDRRIYHPRFMEEGDPWCLISFSIPENNRETRHQLRRRLTWIGCGTVANALWICPAYLCGEVEEIVADLGLTDRVPLFISDEVRGVSDLSAAVQEWWDIDSIRALHDAFLTHGTQAVDAYRADPTPRAAFRAWVTLLDAWRPIPYLDPGLPYSVLPQDWPGRRSIPLFLDFRDSVQRPVAEFIASSIG